MPTFPVDPRGNTVRTASLAARELAYFAARRRALSCMSRTVFLCREELLDKNVGVLRVLFREKVATFHALSVHMQGPLTPNA